MARSRLRGYEERKERRKLTWSIIGIVGIIVFLATFGLQILIGFSVWVDKIRGSSPQVLDENTFLPSPTLDPLPEATNSATLAVTGTSVPDQTILLYLNDTQYGDTHVATDGTFEITNIPVHDGVNTISAKAQDAKGNVSELSNVLTITIKLTPPKLEIQDPPENATLEGDTNTILVTGTTDEDVRVTVNDRLALVGKNGTFSYRMTLSQGDNTITVVATDIAGNQTSLTRVVRYQP